MTKDPFNQTLSVAQGWLDGISQELTTFSEEAIALLLDTLKQGFDKKLQEKPELLLQQLDQLETIIDVELMQSARRR